MTGHIIDSIIWLQFALLPMCLEFDTEVRQYYKMYFQPIHHNALSMTERFSIILLKSLKRSNRLLMRHLLEHSGSVVECLT